MLKDIKGQEKAIKFLSDSLRSERVAGAYLFFGPEGVGKKLAAKNFAKALNCKMKAFDSCDSCTSCRKIDQCIHPDIRWIEAEGEHIKIEQIRKLQSQIALRAYEANWKVFIFRDAHRLTEEAANALLKVLEEPPKRTSLILLTTNIDNLAPTIISRCQKVYFSNLTKRLIKEVLIKDFGLGDNQAHFIATISEGNFKKALEFTQRDLVFKKNEQIDSFLKGNLDSLYGALRGVKEFEEFLGNLCGWFRDVLVLKLNSHSRTIINMDRKEELLGLGKRFHFEDIQQLLQDIMQFRYLLQLNINKKMILDLIKVKLLKCMR